MLIIWYFAYTTVVKISENKPLLKFAALGLQGLSDNGIFYNNSQWDPVSVCARKLKCSWIHLMKWILEVRQCSYVHAQNAWKSLSDILFFGVFPSD